MRQRLVLIPTLFFIVFVATRTAHAQGIEDFSAFSRAIGKEVSVVDGNGLVREGIIESATADGVMLRIGAASRWMTRPEIAGAERLKDESSDGAIKGALWGLLLALLPNQGYDSHAQWFSYSWRIVAGLAAGGYLIDAAQSNRQPLYRAPSASAPALKMSFRF